MKTWRWLVLVGMIAMVPLAVGCDKGDEDGGESGESGESGASGESNEGSEQSGQPQEEPEGPSGQLIYQNELRPTEEAERRLRSLVDAVVNYYSSDGRGMGQFPASQPLTPATVPCGETVTANPDDWTSWSAAGLRFQPGEEHRFSFQFDSAGTGVQATFTAYAFGDIDCDGVLSTFSRSGSGYSDSAAQFSDMVVTNPGE